MFPIYPARGLTPAQAAVAIVLIGVAVGLAQPLPNLAVLVSLATFGLSLSRRSLRSLSTGVVAPLVLLLQVPWPLPVLPTLLIAYHVKMRGWNWGRQTGCLSHSLVGGCLLGTICAIPAYLLVQFQLRETFFALSAEVQPLPLVATAILAIALLNATLEELLWRGWAVDSLQKLGAPLLITVPASSLSFGFAHLSGMPSGPLGITAATSLGLLLAAVRISPGGLVAAVLTHVIVDISIFVAAARNVVWVG